MDYDKLKLLLEMREKGDITEEEYQREKAKLMGEDEPKSSAVGQKPLWGLEENNYIMLMHLSQLAGWVLPLLGYVLPILMWILNKENNPNVDKHGKNIVNFTISYLIYTIVAGLLVLLVVGIPILIVLGILMLVYIIIAAVRAASGQYWKYPMTIEFVK
ncbi:MAG: DUF4870 domain-containing protein [Paludibacter sp.]|nr:DUF4870 domain-containing protein [Paludibacter sp.]